MRKQVYEAIREGRYPMDDDYKAAFADAAKGTRDGWPRAPGGEAWQVDHVIELWMGGADYQRNYMALDPRLHRLKTEVLERFRQLERDRLKVPGEQVEPP